MIKRIFDCSVACLAFLFFIPVMLIVAILVRFKLGAPIVFRQQRSGIYGKPFLLYKFRTMKDIYNEEGKLLPDDERLTPFGRLLRKYSLDELLQLINVIKGDLSLVGPRPLLMDYIPLYNEKQAKRHTVRPGITGWAQVNGRNAISWEDRFELDVWYVDQHYFLLDIKIIWLTVLRVVNPEGISHGNHATMPLFEGSVIHNEVD